MQNREASATPSLALFPAACCWKAEAVTARGESSTQEAPSFAEVVATGFALSAELRLGASRPVRVTVAVPARLAVFERLTLPSANQEELADMVRLQFEKSLPYPVEETTIGFQILSQTAIESAPSEVQGLDDGNAETPKEAGVQTTLLACGIHQASLETFCAPLLERLFPERLTLWAMHVAAQAPLGKTACGLWREEEDVVFGIFESGRLGFLEILGTEPESLLSDLPRVLMSADMAGTPSEFNEILLDPTLSGLGEALSSFLRAPVRELASPQNALPPGEAVDLMPETWRKEQSRKDKNRALRRRIAAAGAIYVVVILALLGDLGFQTRQLNLLRKDAISLQPKVDAVIDRETRWKQLAPAVNPNRSAVELLFQVWQSLPTPETRITRFDLDQNQFVVEGETPNAQQAIEFVEKLRKKPELSDFRFESGQPAILPNDHAQFRIYGKL